MFIKLRGVDRAGGQNLSPRENLSSIREHSFKVRGVKFKGDVRGRSFTQSDKCLECASRGGSGGRHNSGIYEVFK